MIRTSAFALGAALLSGPTAEAGPSFRYCDLTYVNSDVGLDETVSAGNLVSAFGTDDSTGINGLCRFELLGPFYLHGEYEQADFDLDLALSGDVTGAFSTGVDTSTLRVGAGVVIDVPVLPLSAYGQLAFTQVEFDGNFGEVVAGAGQAAFDESETGFDIEVGARGMIGERVDLGGYLRYADLGSFSIPQSIEEIQTDEDIRIGGQAALKIIGPLWGTVRYETGDTDSLFVGARIAF